MHPGSFAPAAEDDVPAIVALMNRAYRGTGAAAGWASEADVIAGDRTTVALLLDDLRTRPHGQLLKWLDPSFEGVAGCVWLEPLGGRTWYLGSLAASTQLQGRGLGRAMLAAAEDRVRAEGGDRIRLTVVNVREAMIAWYLRRGYAPTGEIQPFPYGDDSLGTPLRDDLSFVVLENALTRSGSAT